MKKIILYVVLLIGLLVVVNNVKFYKPQEWETVVVYFDVEYREESLFYRADIMVYSKTFNFVFIKGEGNRDNSSNIIFKRYTDVKQTLFYSRNSHKFNS